LDFYFNKTKVNPNNQPPSLCVVQGKMSERKGSFLPLRRHQTDMSAFFTCLISDTVPSLSIKFAYKNV
jgi:hypothetical protein